MKNTRIVCLGLAWACVLAGGALEAAPAVGTLTVTNVTPTGATLAYSTDEEAEARVLLFSDVGLTRVVPGVGLSPRPIRSDEAAERAALRGLGVFGMSNLLPATTYYVQVELTSSLNGEVIRWPAGGRAFTTAAGFDPLRSGALSLGSSLVVDLTPPAGTRLGALVTLEVQGALAPLSTFVGEGLPAESASFDLTNLVSAQGGVEYVPAEGAEVVLTAVEGFQQVHRRGYRWLPGANGGRGQLGPHAEVLELEEGWSFFGLPLEVADPQVEEVFGEVMSSLEELWCLREGEWLGYVPGQPSALTTLAPLEGCAARMSQPGQLTLEGPRVLDPLWLTVGWHVQALPLRGEQSPASWLEGQLQGGDIASIWSWSAQSQGWEVFEPGGPDWWQGLGELTPGTAYYLSVASDAWLEEQ